MKLNRTAYPQVSPVNGFEEADARQLRFSMGNGFILNSILDSADPLLHLASLVDELQSDDRLLFSREALMKEIPHRLSEIADLAEAVGLGHVEILLFVRDPLEHAYSLYGQMVKAHGCIESIVEWLPKYNLNDALESFLEAVSADPRCHLTVHNYSRAPAAIFGQAAEWLALPNGSQTLTVEPGIHVNRSLQLDELRLMLLLNRHLGRRASAIGRLLVESTPAPGDLPSQVPPEAQDIFICRMEASVARINARLPEPAHLRLQRLPCNLTGLDQAGHSLSEQSLKLTTRQLEVVVEGLLHCHADV